MGHIVGPIPIFLANFLLKIAQIILDFAYLSREEALLLSPPKLIDSNKNFFRFAKCIGLHIPASIEMISTILYNLSVLGKNKWQKLLRKNSS